MRSAALTTKIRAGKKMVKGTKEKKETRSPNVVPLLDQQFGVKISKEGRRPDDTRLIRPSVSAATNGKQENCLLD